MVERELYPDIVIGAKADGVRLSRIGDSPYGKKPFDIVGVAPGGRAVAVEVKITDKDRDFDGHSKLLSDHQSTWLQIYVEMGALVLFAVYVRELKKLKVYVMSSSNQSVYFTSERVGNQRLFRGWKPLL